MTHPTRGSTQGFELPGLTGFTFQLALHGSRMQLEAPPVGRCGAPGWSPRKTGNTWPTNSAASPAAAWAEWLGCVA
ncbi:MULTISPECIES: hypothetical protein [Cyanobium]|uniref:hypothetical protein n=1 Tax=Cyanobium TaxID=167375 RepID=UPI000FC9B821|nr:MULTISPECIES: hypothetical protein [Cyanobium]MCP9781576.1 hypothetical protein [Cyanobium sp. To12R1]